MEKIKQRPLSMSKYRILVVLAYSKAEGMTPTEIGVSFGKNRWQTASSWACRHLKGLVQGDLVTKVGFNYKITARGRAYLVGQNVLIESSGLFVSPGFTFRDLQSERSEWAAHNFGNQNPWELFMGIVSEIGELAHAYSHGHRGIRTRENHTLNEQDAIADIVIYLAGYCSARGWDFEELVERVWRQVQQRDWKADPENAGGVSVQEQRGH